MEGGRLFCLLAAAISASGCAALTGRQPVIEKRFADYRYGADAGSVQIAVSTSDASPTAPAGISLTALGDRAQTALIQQTKGKPPATIKPDGGPDTKVSLRNTVSRHIVIAVRPATFLPPGDRIDAVRISLQVAQPLSEWRISSWTQASNGQRVIDLGKSTDTSTSKVTASAGLTAEKVANLTLGGETDQTNQREVEIKDATDFDAAVDNKGHAWLDETAGWRESLAHNLSMDVVLTAPLGQLRSTRVISTGKLTIDDPKQKGSTRLAQPNQVHLTERSVYTPNGYDTLPICGWATLTYRIRHIRNNANSTFSESDDSVQFNTGVTSAAFLMSPPPAQPFYVIDTQGLAISYQVPNALPRPMIFASLEEATAFRDWLAQVAPAKGRVARTTIGLQTPRGVRGLSAAELRATSPQLLDQRQAIVADWEQSCESTRGPGASLPGARPG